MSDAGALAWDSDPDGLALVDHAGVIAATNRSFDELVGHAEDGVLGRSIGDLLAPEDAAMLLASTAATNSSRVSGIRGDGHPFTADVSTFRPPSGNTIFVRLETRSAARAAILDEILAHALSHDVQSRLRCVQGFLDLAVDRTVGESLTTADPYLQRAALALAAGDRMVSGVVNLLRVGSRPLQLVPTPLEPLLIEAGELASLDLDLKLGIDAQAKPMVFADGPLLRDVFVELFRNSVEFARDGVVPAAVVTAERSAGWCRLHISDNGRGMPEELTEDALTIFRQLQPRNWERGVGVGLAACKMVVEQHAGAIQLHSDEETGTTVELRLPLAPCAARPS